MPRWPTFSSRATAPPLVAGGAVLGLIAVASGRGGADVRRWLPDLAVGLVFVVAGTYVLPRRGGTGLLLAATGYAWFIDTAASSFEFLHRGPLVHLLFTFPELRPVGRARAAAVAGAYAAAVFWPVWGDESVATVLAVAVVALTMALHAKGTRGRRDRRPAVAAAGLFAIAVLMSSIVLPLAGPGARSATLYAYELTMVAIAIVLAAGAARPAAAAVSDMVVDLGGSSTSSLRDAFAAALGDPTLDFGYWTAGTGDEPGAYVGPDGHRVELPSSDSPRSATFVDVGPEPLAVLVHDPGVLDDAELVDGVLTATRLLATNAALTDQVRGRVHDLTASRRRLMVAADRARHTLETRLDDGVGARVERIEARVRRAVEHCGAGGDDNMRLAAEHLARSVDDLRLLGRGLRPRELDEGVGAAIRALGRRCPLPVAVTDTRADVHVTTEVATAVYYVCAEALTNVVKHAGASRAWIELQPCDGGLVAVVSDDGHGGAVLGDGSGLRGLADRVAAFGGTLSVASSPGGTTLRAQLPADGASR